MPQADLQPSSNQIKRVHPGRCPVCRARFRKTTECTRCGADLKPLMILAARAHLFRKAARSALLKGQFKEALEQASVAQQIAESPSGEKLMAASNWFIENKIATVTLRRTP